jgi:probable HAF family extracellular repeat protein
MFQRKRVNLIVLSIACLPAQAAAVLSYSAVDLGTLGGTYSYAHAINSTGQVVGYSSTAGDAQQHAFLYSTNRMVDLATLNVFGGFSLGLGINDEGDVTGASYTPQHDSHAFLYAAGAMTDLGTLGGRYSTGFGVNASAQVTGGAYTRQTDAGPGQYEAFLYSRGAMISLGTLGGTYSAGYGINAAGQITGYAAVDDGATHAFLYSGGTMKDLGTLGGTSATGQAINSAGQVAGFASTAGDVAYHAFLYSEGIMTDLGTLGAPLGSFGSIAYSVNDRGQVVGYSDTAENTEKHAFLYSDGVMYDLNSLLASAIPTILVAAYGINDSGQIVANGADQHAYLLTPSNRGVAEPGSLALLIAAIGGFVALPWGNRRISVARSVSSPVVRGIQTRPIDQATLLAQPIRLHRMNDAKARSEPLVGRTRRGSDRAAVLF